MGLDMYAVRRLRFRDYNHLKPHQRYKAQLEYGGRPVPGIKSDSITSVDEQVMYWRKANQIHGWFVKNVQNKFDDCKPYHVDFETLQYLLDDCKRVIEASILVDGMIVVGETLSSSSREWEPIRQPGKVIENSVVAETLLPATSGFFFGNYDYDEGYLDEVIQTQEWAERMLHDHQTNVPGEIYYQADW